MQLLNSSGPQWTADCWNSGWLCELREKIKTFVFFGFIKSKLSLSPPLHISKPQVCCFFYYIVVFISICHMQKVSKFHLSLILTEGSLIKKRSGFEIFPWGTSTLCKSCHLLFIKSHPFHSIIKIDDCWTARISSFPLMLRALYTTCKVCPAAVYATLYRTPFSDLLFCHLYNSRTWFHDLFLW